MQPQQPLESVPSSAGASGVLIREAGEADMGAAQSIYAHHVLHGLASF